VVIALTTGAIVCGLNDGRCFEAAFSIFSKALGGSAEISLSYGILGTFTFTFTYTLAHFVFSNF
jgi:predicted histidine transporter YuiF (NhaC family)